MKLLLFIPLYLSAFAFAKDSVSNVMTQLAYHTPVVLTFAGLKPFCTEIPDPFGMSAEDLVAGLNSLRDAGYLSNPEVEWHLHDTGVTGKKHVMFIHLGAVARVAATADGQRFLKAAGIAPNLSPPELVAALFKISLRPQSRQTPDEFSAMGLFYGIPATQVDSYRTSLGQGHSPAKQGSMFNWFSGFKRASPGFVVQPGDSNQDELKRLHQATQSAWEQFFQEVHLRSSDALLALSTLDQHRFLPNMGRAMACKNAWELLRDRAK